MTGERTLPGLGLTGFWGEGSGGWKTGMDANLRQLSALVQLSVLSRITALPGVPADGDIYIVPFDAVSNADEIALRDNGAWVYIAPKEGWQAFIADDDEYVFFDGTAWTVIESGGDAPATELVMNDQTDSYVLALTDVGKYVRINKATAANLTVPANATVAFLTGTVIPIRQVGAGQVTVVADTDVTINTNETLKLRKQGSGGTLTKVAADEWDLTADVELAP